MALYYSLTQRHIILEEARTKKNYTVDISIKTYVCCVFLVLFCLFIFSITNGEASAKFMMNTRFFMAGHEPMHTKTNRQTQNPHKQWDVH